MALENGTGPRKESIGMTIGTRRLTYSVEEAATVLGVSRSKLYASLRKGELRGVQVGRQVVIPCDVLEGLIGGVAPEDPDGQRRESARASGESSRAQLNSVRLAGMVTRPPQLRLSKNQLEVCVLDLTVGRRRRDNGTAPFSVDVVTFGAMARHAVSLGTGELIRVAGRLDRREWTTHDGSVRSAHRVVAWHVSRLDSGESDAS
jgi:excisionase family DNA binding protein